MPTVGSTTTRVSHYIPFELNKAMFLICTSLLMSIPVQAATTLFAPHPEYAQKPAVLTPPEQQRRSSLDKDAYFDIFKKYDPPALIGNVFEGWLPHNMAPEENAYSSSNTDESEDSDHFSEISRPGSPEPTLDIDKLESHVQQDRLRQDSVHMGNRITALLRQDDIKEAVSVLQDAITYVGMTQLGSEFNNNDVAKTYSLILQLVCNPKMTKVINETIGTPKSINDSIQWNLFTKIIEAGYTLEDDAYIAIVQFLMNQDQLSLALKALYLMPRPLWDFNTYKLAIALHLLQTPKQVQQAECLLSDFGKPYIEILNPLAPTDLPPLRIDTPLMKNTTDQERFRLWMFYQEAMGGTEWDTEKRDYEMKRRQSINQLNEEQQGKRRNSTLVQLVMQRMGIQKDRHQIQNEKIDMDNSMIYTSLVNQQFEYGWGIYLSMEDAVNEFTPCVVMHLCWRAFAETPISLVSTQSWWESRAWEVYSRFMCSEYLQPDEPEMPGFLFDLLSIIAFSPEKQQLARYTKVMSVYHLLERNHFDNLLQSEQVISPTLCMFLLECSGSDATVQNMCQKASEIWSKSRPNRDKTYPFSICWAILVLCIRSGQVSPFISVLEDLTELYHENNARTPLSIFAPIQTFHDRYLDCNHPDDETPKTCYFYDYLFRPIKYTDDQAPGTDYIEMDEWGFVPTESKETHQGQQSDVIEPFAYIDDVLDRRTDIREAHAERMAIAASMGATKNEQHIPRQVFYTFAKATGLIRHCLHQVASNQ